MEIRELTCKSILTRATGYLRDVVSHSVNPYVGCGFGRSACGVGCYVQHNRWLTQGREWGRFVDIKINAAESYRKTWKYEKNWAAKRGQSFFIFLSSSTDPWQPVEEKYRVTRQLLKAFCDAPPDGVILQTHSDKIREDCERIGALAQRCDLRVHLSIEGDGDRLPGFLGGLRFHPISPFQNSLLLEEQKSAPFFLPKSTRSKLEILGKSRIIQYQE